MPKCKCGNEVASNAKFCPKCGHRFTSRLVKALAWFFGLTIGLPLLAAILSRDSTNTPTSTPAPTQAEQLAKKLADAKEELIFQRAVAGAKTLKESMRNPDSFKLSQALMMNDGAVCYEYRAQNGFGGMNVGQAVLSPKGKFKSSESDGFSSLWNKECAHKIGTDKTWEVGYGAGLHGLLSDK